MKVMAKKNWQTIDNALYRKSLKTIPDAISVNKKLIQIIKK